MTVLELDLSQRVTKVLDVVRHFTVNERIVWAKLLLDTVVAGDGEESADWQSLGLKAFEAEWDNPSDAIYDDWRAASPWIACAAVRSAAAMNPL